MKNIFKLIYYPKKIVAEEILADSIENKKKNIWIIFTIISILTIIDTTLLFYSPLSFFWSFTAKDLILNIVYTLLAILIITIILSALWVFITDIFWKNENIPEEYLKKSGEKWEFLDNFMTFSICILLFEIASFITILIYFIFLSFPFIILLIPILILAFIIHVLFIYWTMLSVMLNTKWKTPMIVIFTIIGSIIWLNLWNNFYYKNFKEEEISKAIEIQNNKTKELSEILSDPKNFITDYENENNYESEYDYDYENNEIDLQKE